MPAKKSAPTKKSKAAGSSRSASARPSPQKVDGLTVILGSDEAEVKRQALEAASQLTPDSAEDEFSREIIDGAAENVEEAIERLGAAAQAAQTFPFFGGKLVWLKSANMFADNQLGRSERVQAAADDLIDTVLHGLPDGVHFLLSAIDVDKRRSFYKALQKMADIQVFDKVDVSRGGWEDEVMAAAESFSRERGFRFDAQALDLFVQLVGADSRQLRNELEKLDLFRGDIETVAIEDVRLLVPRSKASIIWELGGAISRRDTGWALQMVDELLAQNESPMGLLYASIIPTVRNLLLAADLMERHRLSPPRFPGAFGKQLESLTDRATEHLPRRKDGKLNTFALGMAAMDAERFTVDELREALAQCLEANRKLITTGLEPRIILSSLVVSITG